MNTIRVCFALLAGLVGACSGVKEASTSPPDQSESIDAGPGGGDAGEASAPDASDAGKIGQLITTGISTVNVDLSSKTGWTCTGACAEQGGRCTTGGNGAGLVYRKYNNGSGSTWNRISSCDVFESYVSGNTTMTQMSCYCDGLRIPPHVRVGKSEGFFACGRVCASWSLACDSERKSFAYADEKESKSTLLGCDDVPPETSDHYQCACKE